MVDMKKIANRTVHRGYNIEGYDNKINVVVLCKILKTFKNIISWNDGVVKAKKWINDRIDRFYLF